MDWLLGLLEGLKQALGRPLIVAGGISFTLWMLAKLLLLVFTLFFVTSLFRRWFQNKFLARTRMEPGTRQALAALLQYLLLGFGLLVLLQTTGIDLTSVNVLAGAVGIGLGFGLQNIANNFICGLIIFWERPIKIGDRIAVGDVEGDVVEIGARSTTVVTNDNISVIVPNSKFIVENVVNWSHNDRRVRFHIPVDVAYGNDPEKVGKLLLRAAKENPEVLKDPAPGVRLMGFGENGLKFELRAWTDSLIHRKGLLTSKLNLSILRKFGAAGVEIPPAQLEVLLKRKPRRRRRARPA